MKRNFLVPVLALSMLSTALVSCNKDKELKSESNKVETTMDGASYTINQEASKIDWKGSKIFEGQEDGHFGVIKFESADITIKDGKLESGKFIADMNSIHALDIEDVVKAGKLDGHLKDGDFFEVEKFPTATYEITKVTPAEEGSDFNTVLDGNLTVKGITKPVQFKANVEVTDDMVKLSTEAQNINRQEFGVTYKADMKDVVLKDEINVQIHIEANVAK